MGETWSPRHRPASSPATAAGRAERVAWIALVAAVAALVAALFDRGGSVETWSPPEAETVSGQPETPGGTAENAAGWRLALARERAARLELQTSLRKVEEQLAAALDARGAYAAGDRIGDEQERRPSGGVRQRGLDEEILVSAGFDPADARELKLAYDQLQMDQLYARDRAAREGFDARETWQAAIEELGAREQALADRYGEVAYDWMLYASGRPNQVAVEQVFSGSPAAAAGLIEGDVVLRYAEERIRNGHELREATTEGVAGEWVEVEILREGRRERVRMPRGPLGVTVEVDSVAPDSG